MKSIQAEAKEKLEAFKGTKVASWLSNVLKPQIDIDKYQALCQIVQSGINPKKVLEKGLYLL